MSRLRPMLAVLVSMAALTGVGCDGAPGKPHPGPEVVRPDHVLDFATLYGQNCVACHGDNRQAGAAISLANPVYLAVAGEANLKNAIANGVPGKLMPPFSRSAGGMLTEEQVDIVANGLVSAWGKPGLLEGKSPPPYKASLHPDAAAGAKVFSTYCAECHGANGEGKPDDVKGSIVDPSFLALVSDQNLRSFVIAGIPASHMPDWQAHDGQPPMTDQEITDVVAWLGAHRQSNAAPTEAPPSATKHQEPHS